MLVLAFADAVAVVDDDTALPDGRCELAECLEVVGGSRSRREWRQPDEGPDRLEQ